MRKVTLRNWGNNETYSKNEDSEGNSYTLTDTGASGRQRGWSVH